jgi:transposase
MLPLRSTPSHPWSPLTDGEWHALEPYLLPQKAKKGRPPRDRRRTWDAIFWIACSDKPWIALPSELGRPDTTHSALIYVARNGVLSQLLVAVSRHPLANPALESLEYRIACAFRRAARQLPPEELLLARNLGMATALPFDAAALPAQGGPEAPLTPDRVRLTPRIPRRALRGLPPLRLPKGPPRPHPRAPGTRPQPAPRLPPGHAENGAKGAKTAKRALESRPSP